MAKKKQKIAAGSEAKAVKAEVPDESSEMADVIPITPVVGESAPGARAIGWTQELSTRLNWVLQGKPKMFGELALEIDLEVGHFVAGIVAIAHGDYELAALNLWRAGMIEAPSVVEETEE